MLKDLRTPSSKSLANNVTIEQCSNASYESLSRNRSGPLSRRPHDAPLSRCLRSAVFLRMGHRYFLRPVVLARAPLRHPLFTPRRRQFHDFVESILPPTPHPLPPQVSPSRPLHTRLWDAHYPRHVLANPRYLHPLWHSPSDWNIDSHSPFRHKTP